MEQLDAAARALLEQQRAGRQQPRGGREPKIVTGHVIGVVADGRLQVRVGGPDGPVELVPADRRGDPGVGLVYLLHADGQYVPFSFPAPLIPLTP